MTRYQVDSEAVFNATGAARSTIVRIQSDCAALIGQLTALQDSWTGAASSAFAGVVSDWRGAQHQVDQILTALGTALGQAGQQYLEAEEANTRLFSR